jgi:hypothetical protein
MIAVAALTILALALLVLAARAAERAWTRRIDRRDAELAQERIAAYRRLAELKPEDIPSAPDLTPGQVRKLRRRQHPIAHKRAGRRI